MKILKAFLLLLLLGALFAGFTAWWLQQYAYSPAGFSGSKVFIVEKGHGINQIAQEMNDQGIIRYPMVLKLLAKYEKKTNPKFGEYSFESDMSPSQILERMEKGEKIIRKIVVPEGKTVAEIYAMMKESPRLKLIATENEIPVDGSLRPSTYYYTYGDTDLDVFTDMQRDMTSVIDELWEKRASDLPIKTKEEALTLASIIEKETGVNDERSVVASVFINRLNKGMKLESDPTAVYGITKGVPLGRKPTAADINNDNKFNTYKIPGLPPHPICNPGRESIEAALNPAQTEFLFFVADGKGGHNFAKTYPEHVKNIEAYRAILKAAAPITVKP